jgi:maleylacetoacetate isomerase
MSKLVLHGYWRSSAAYRVRIALNLKQLAYDQVGHDLRRGKQMDPAYRAIAPAGLVPAVEYEGQSFVQSLAILEWLEERWPSPPLLPGPVEQRAVVRAMAATIAADIHPLNNLRILKYLKNEFERSQQQIDTWVARWIGEGFAALEVMIARHGDGFAFADFPTMADCFVVPQVYNAERFGVDMAPYPRLTAAAATARSHPAFVAAHPDRQPDADPA